MKFSKNFKFMILVPAVIILAGIIVGIACGGMNLGIDFTGGTMMTIDMGQDFDSSVVVKAFENQGFSAPRSRTRSRPATPTPWSPPPSAWAPLRAASWCGTPSPPSPSRAC